MRKINVLTFLTMDGVMQGPGGPEEDTSNGFNRGGWSVGYFDEAVGQEMGKQMGGKFDLLLGRRTYETMAANWPHMPQDNPFTTWINAMEKFVASRTLTEPLDWNATLLSGELGSAVSAIKETDGPDLTVLGSGVLVQSLREHGLIDEYLLSIYPLVLGSGSRLFPDGAAADLTLTDSVTTTTGVIVGRFRPRG